MSAPSVDCPNCGAPAPGGAPGSTVTCGYCRVAYTIPLPPPPPAVPHTGQPFAAHAGAGAAGTEAPLAQRGTDPLDALCARGVWGSIRTGHELLYLGDDLVLDWVPATGGYHVWRYDRTVAEADPFPSAHAHGRWGSIGVGHTLLWLGGEHLLDWEPASGAFRLWWFDRSATGEADVLPSLVSRGQWGSIGATKSLVYLGHDQVLDWEPSTGRFRIWHFDRQAGEGDPLPGGPLSEGEWSSIRTGHELIACAGHVLDFVPGAGNYRVWLHDPSARGQGGDPFPVEVAAGNWSSIRHGHRLIYLGGDRVLDWEPDSGAYRIWSYVR